MGKNDSDIVRKRESYLRENTDILMTVFNGLPGYAVIAADFDGNILAFNDGAERIYGDLRKDVVGKRSIDSFFAGESMQGARFQRMVAEVMEKGDVSFEADKVRKNRERFPAKCHLALTRSTGGEILGFVEIAEDVTLLKSAQAALVVLNAELERKVAERATWLEVERERLDASEKRFRAMFESANDAVIGMEPPGVVSMWNSKAETMFGYAGYEIIGKALHETIVPEKYRRSMATELPRFFETGEGKVVGKTVDLEGLRKDGSLFPIELSISAAKMRGAWNALGIVRDISERKRAEKEIRRNLDETERMNRIMVGRELKIVELKKEMAAMRARLKELEAALTNR